jgi:hypothetical protein
MDPMVFELGMFLIPPVGMALVVRLENNACKRPLATTILDSHLIEVRSEMPSKACYNSMHDAAVAQLDRVLGYEPRGRGFDSCQPHQKLESPQRKLWAFSFF